MPASLDELIAAFRCTFFPVQVLVVDDDVTARAAMRRVLERAGFSVIVAEHGEDALRLLEGTHIPVDLLVTDVQMPGIQGGQLAARVRETWPELPVLFVSGEPRNARLAVETPGPTRFLAKPFLPAELLGLVQAGLDLPAPDGVGNLGPALELGA
ncbi:MAG: response regulator [Thermoleophilia bacterium]|nr:response regulator [Thermoleophilia bacterium]